VNTPLIEKSKIESTITKKPMAEIDKFKHTQRYAVKGGTGELCW